MKCPNCNKTFGDEHEFCPECGAKLLKDWEERPEDFY